MMSYEFIDYQNFMRINTLKRILILTFQQFYQAVKVGKIVSKSRRFLEMSRQNCRKKVQ